MRGRFYPASHLSLNEGRFLINLKIEKEKKSFIMVEKSRQMRQVFIILIIFVLLLSIIACQHQEKKRYEAQFLRLFDTVTQIVAYRNSKEEFTGQVNQIYNDLEEYHQLYDIYHEYEGIVNVKVINDQAGQEPLEVDRRIIDLLLFAKEIYQKTEGRVNVALGSVLSIWHNYRERGIMDPENAKIPPIGLLKEAECHTDIHQIVIDESASTVFLADADMLLDVGAIAKGYAVEQVSRKAYQNGFTSGLISVGGNVKIMGTKDSRGKLWNVGIQNPDTPSEESNLYVVYLADKAVATSGNYQRYYTVDGKEYHHIINPDTLYPAEYFTATTIICKDSGRADALSTAIFTIPLEQGLKLVESLSDTEALWILPDGEQRFSSGFQEILAEQTGE